MKANVSPTQGLIGILIRHYFITLTHPDTMGSANGKIIVTEEQIENLSKSSGLEKEKVKQQCQNFLADHPKGKMNKREFTKFSNIALANTRKIDMSKMAEHIFRMYDINRDGNVTFVEFMVVYGLMVNGSAEENLRKIFQIFDINDDGKISLREMNILVKNISVMLEYHQGAKASKEYAQKVFKEMDKDDNGEVTREEFIAAILSQEEASKFLALKVIDIFV